MSHFAVRGTLFYNWLGHRYVAGGKQKKASPLCPCTMGPLRIGNDRNCRRRRTSNHFHFAIDAPSFYIFWGGRWIWFRQFEHDQLATEFDYSVCCGYLLYFFFSGVFVQCLFSPFLYFIDVFLLVTHVSVFFFWTLLMFAFVLTRVKGRARQKKNRCCQAMLLLLFLGLRRPLGDAGKQHTRPERKCSTVSKAKTESVQ